MILSLSLSRHHPEKFVFFLQNFTRQSKLTYGIVMEEVTTRDESSHISPNGQRVLPSGGISADGPPTTLSGTGIDRMAFLQANITRDNTKYVNGAIVGRRNVFQVGFHLYHSYTRECSSINLSHIIRVQKYVGFSIFMSRNVRFLSFF